MEATSPPARGPRLRLVCVNDVYSLAHLPRLRTLVQHYAVSDPPDRLLVTLAGDFLAPSMLSSLDAGRGMVDCLNQVPVTHVTFGNHEDDVPTEQLRRRIEEFQGVWLASNVRALEPALPVSQALTVESLGGRTVRVGLLGVVMNDPSIYHRAPFGGGPVENPNTCVEREAARLLSEEGCACVVPLTHQALAEDLALVDAPRAVPFPVVLGGHEHTPYLERRGATWLLKAGTDATHAVLVDLEWPAEAPPLGAPDLPAVTVKRVPVSDFAENDELRQRVERHLLAVHELERATLCTLAEGAEPLSSVGSRARQCTMGTLVCTQLREGLQAELCLFNGGGIRASRDYHGRFTYGDLEAELPFDNEVVVLRLPGSVVRDAVRASRARAPAEWGGFLQVDDGVLVDRGEVRSVRGETLAPAREYRVALVREMLLGMDHNEPLERFAKEHPERVPAQGSGREVKLVLTESFARSFWRELGSFDSLDADKDGVVGVRDLARAVERRTGEAPSQLTLDLLVRTADANNDRSISREELARVQGRSGSKG